MYVAEADLYNHWRKRNKCLTLEIYMLYFYNSFFLSLFYTEIKATIKLSDYSFILLSITSMIFESIPIFFVSSEIL